MVVGTVLHVNLHARAQFAGVLVKRGLEPAFPQPWRAFVDDRQGCGTRDWPGTSWATRLASSVFGSEERHWIPAKNMPG